MRDHSHVRRYVSVTIRDVVNRPVSRKRKNVRNVINQRDVTAGVHCAEYFCMREVGHVDRTGPLTVYLFK